MNPHLIIHHTHDYLIIGLFINNALKEKIINDKKSTSKELISSIDYLLKAHNIDLADILFIGINQGPGMFSTLRSIIATVNALHFALSIPIIGIDSLEATAKQFYNAANPYMATLFNACNNEVYYAITDHKAVLCRGYATIIELGNILEKTVANKEIYFIGNGTTTYKEEIRMLKNISARIEEDTPQICSLEMIQESALQKYYAKDYASYLFPLYLKKHAVER